MYMNYIHLFDKNVRVANIHKIFAMDRIGKKYTVRLLNKG